MKIILGIILIALAIIIFDVDLKSTSTDNNVATVKVETTQSNTEKKDSSYENAGKAQQAELEQKAKQAELEQKYLSIHEWCNKYYLIIYDIEDKWQNFRENNSEFVIPMQNLARSMESAHNKIENSSEYQIPENAPEDLKYKMQEEIDNLFDAMENLAYALRVMTECVEEVSGSNDLSNRMVIPYGASESEIYYHMENAKNSYTSAKNKFEKAKNLLSEIDDKDRVYFSTGR